MKNLKKFKSKETENLKKKTSKGSPKKKKAKLSYESHEKPKNKKHFYNELFEEE